MPKQVSTGFVEGGPYYCSKKDFTTESVEEWNKHCIKDDPNNHLESGYALCPDCGEQLRFEGKPYTPKNPLTGAKTFTLQCDDCYAKTKGRVKVKKLTTVSESKKAKGEKQ